MLCVSDCVGDSVSIAIPQPTEWQRIGNQIEAAFIFARADFVSVHQRSCSMFPHRFVVLSRSNHRSWPRDQTRADCGSLVSEDFAALDSRSDTARAPIASLVRCRTNRPNANPVWLT